MNREWLREKGSPIATLMVASVIIGGSIGFAARANADGTLDPGEANYVNRYHGAVCSVIDDYPSPAGVMGVLAGITDDGWDADSGVDIINASVEVYCPRHWPLLQSIGNRARANSVSDKVRA